MLFYTFCVDIGKHPKNQLIATLILLSRSIHKHIKNYKLICFTNFNINQKSLKQYNIIYRKYYDKSKHRIYNDNWLNLSFNKIRVYKDLYDEYKKDFIWIDLDTIITSDISYFDELSNFFINNGGESFNKTPLIKNNNKITVPRHKCIQGNIWKLNINLYNDLMNTYHELKSKNMILIYDLQDLFSYHFYIKHNKIPDNINILGYNKCQNNIYGLCLWSKLHDSHPNINGLNNLYYDDNNNLKSKYHEDKEIHIVSFTFDKLKTFFNNNHFRKLFIFNY